MTFALCYLQSHLSHKTLNAAEDVDRTSKQLITDRLSRQIQLSKCKSAACMNIQQLEKSLNHQGLLETNPHTEKQECQLGVWRQFVLY